eukprot:scaffold19988_cov126-Isochrysis_galbana.AAC.1
MLSSGEYGTLAADSFWQVPAQWNGLSMVTGPHDGAGMQVLSKGLLRYYVNNEISAGSGIPLRYSATADAGSPGQPFPSLSESFVMNGATIRYFDMEVEYEGGATKYTHVSSGVAVKRLYISTDAAPEGELVTSVDKMKELTGLVGMSRWCGGSFHIQHQFSHLLDGAGFQDALYLAGHEEGGFGGVGVLDPATGSTYLLPTSTMVETATPLYSGSTDYVTMVVNIYPEAGVGQRVHLYVGKKVGTDFLGRNGLNPKYGQFYVLTVPGHETWDNMAAEQAYPSIFVPVETATGAINSGNAKNEWSSANQLNPTMWAHAMTEIDDIAVFQIAYDAGTDGLLVKNGIELPAQVTASAKRFRLKEVDPLFGFPDGIYWSPKGFLLMAEDGATGRLLRMALDAAGNSDRRVTMLARVGDESLRTQLNSIPALSMTASSQAEFTGILPHGFYHVLNAGSSPEVRLQAELDGREQYLVNLQLHSLTSGLLKALSLGEGTQLLRVDVEPDPVNTAARLYAWQGVGYYNGKRTEYCAANDCSAMRGPFNMEPALPFAWLGVGYYNGKRTEYCAANDCSAMRGPFVPGEVVLESDFEVLEVWRGLAPGTYMDDLQAIIDESLSYKNMELALPFAWLGVGYYNGKRTEIWSLQVSDLLLLICDGMNHPRRPAIARGARAGSRPCETVMCPSHCMMYDVSMICTGHFRRRLATMRPYLSPHLGRGHDCLCVGRVVRPCATRMVAGESVTVFLSRTFGISHQSARTYNLIEYRILMSMNMNRNRARGDYSYSTHILLRHMRDNDNDSQQPTPTLTQHPTANTNSITNKSYATHSTYTPHSIEDTAYSRQTTHYASCPGALTTPLPPSSFPIIGIGPTLAAIVLKAQSTKYKQFKVPTYLALIPYGVNQCQCLASTHALLKAVAVDAARAASFFFLAGTSTHTYQARLIPPRYAELSNRRLYTK